MMILGIETSCDDTGVALVEATRGKFYVRSNAIISQAKLHNKYGGVVPELAARNHLKNIIPAIDEVLSPLLSEERVRVRSEGAPAIDAIAVTAGPGLATSLHVGVETAKTLALAWNIPLVGANHMEGHIYSPLLQPTSPPQRSGRGGVRGGARDTKQPRINFPAIALIVSGGHTELILMAGHGQYKLLGKTRDDAAGEAFDKAAQMLGLPYPGGPAISKHAEKGDPNSFEIPRPMIERDDCEFSFSGMKNAIRLIVEKISPPASGSPKTAEGIFGVNRGGDKGGVGEEHRLPANVINDLCASIQQAIVDILVTKSLIAIAVAAPKTFILAGGVAANKLLRETIAKNLPKSVRLLISSLAYSQDNGAMIAASAYWHITKKQFDSPESLTANAHWELV